MRIEDLIDRPPLVAWSGTSKIPWNEPGFSRRMLREHLSQSHDRASRRFATIDLQVDWLHRIVLGGRPGRILDLGCGPGFYAERLARRGHRCIGIDFSPASVDYAKEQAKRGALACEYRLEDLRTADFGADFDVALLCHGELNAFAPHEARSILARARRALAPAGALVLEVHRAEVIEAIGRRAPGWFTSRESVFADEPHLCLAEASWDPEAGAASERWFVLPLGPGDPTCYVNTLQAYSDSEYEALLRGAGFGTIEEQPSLSGSRGVGETDYFVLVAR